MSSADGNASALMMFQFRMVLIDPLNVLLKPFVYLSEAVKHKIVIGCSDSRTYESMHIRG